MTLANRMTHQPKSNKEPSTDDLIFSIRRLLTVYAAMPGITKDEKEISGQMLKCLDLLK